MKFIVSVAAHLPNFILRRLYRNPTLRKGIAFRLSGVTINPGLAELDVALTVKSAVPVELSRIDFTMTWNYKDYFTRITETRSEQILNEVTISFRRKLTTEEVSRVREGMLFLAGDAEFKTKFSEFTRVFDLSATASLKS